MAGKTIKAIEEAGLAPCPFCGSDNVYIWRVRLDGTPDRDMRFVRCGNCRASTDYLQRSEAIKAWNRRAR